jgi:hypothetical protein
MGPHQDPVVKSASSKIGRTKSASSKIGLTKSASSKIGRTRTEIVEMAGIPTPPS